MTVAASATALTSGSATLTKNLAVAGNASVNTLALLGVQVRMAASRNVSATTAANLGVIKQISGAGDEVTAAVAAIKITVNLDGGLQSNASADTSVLYITKKLNGYALSQAVITKSRLTRVFFHSGIAAGVEVNKIEFGAVELESIEMQRVA
jgi:galactokinase